MIDHGVGILCGCAASVESNKQEGDEADVSSHIRLKLPTRNRLVRSVALFATFMAGIALIGVQQTQAQTGPTIVSTIPVNLATGVSATAPVVFTFSTAMNTSATYPIFFDAAAPGVPVFTVNTWSADAKTLTATPQPSFPSPNKVITWSMNGFSEDFDFLAGTTTGVFTTSGGTGGGTGSGTNKISTFSVGRTAMYQQTSSGTPFLDHDSSYGFQASGILASNRTATSISVAVPTHGSTTLFENPVSPEMFFDTESSTNLTAIDASFPNGDYVFNVQSATSNQLVTVTLPASLMQPPAPHLSNFSAAQAVDPSKPFTLTWDGFAGGTAGDHIGVQIGTNFTTLDFGDVSALNGTATSVVIPANTLPPNHFFDNGNISFAHIIGPTNGANSTVAYRVTSTQFFLTTTAASVVSNISLGGITKTASGVSFDVASSPSATLTVEYSSALKGGTWSTLYSTNSASGHVTVTDSTSSGNALRFYRVRNGN